MKRKKQTGYRCTEHGLYDQHIIEKYSVIPMNMEDLKKGHIIHLFIENENSLLKSFRAISSVYPNFDSRNKVNMKAVYRKFECFKSMKEGSQAICFNFCSTKFKILPPLSSLPETLPKIPADSLIPEPLCSSTGSSTPLPALKPSKALPVKLVPDLSSHDANSAARKRKRKESLESCPKSCRVPVVPAPAPAPSSLELSLHGKGLPRREQKLKRQIEFMYDQHKALKEMYERKVQNLKNQLKDPRHSLKTGLQTELMRKKEAMKVKDEIIAHLTKRINEADSYGFKAKLKKRLRRYEVLEKSYHAKRREKTVPIGKMLALKKELQEKDITISKLESEITEVEDLLAKHGALKEKTKKDKKTYDVPMRMVVYEAIVSEVATQEIPLLIENNARTKDKVLSAVPHRNTVEKMARELMFLADLKCAEFVMETENLTIGFDVATHDKSHISCVHVTTESDRFIVAMDQLAGCTVDDYHEQVISAIDNLASIYAAFHDKEYQFCHGRIIDNIANIMSDRLIKTEATIKRVNETLDKPLRQVNCHLDPIDTIASLCKSTLKSLECLDEEERECLIVNIVSRINKLYCDKNSKEDFKSFLAQKNLPESFIPTGNRLHVLFCVCERLFCYYDQVLDFLSSSVKCSQALLSLKKHFVDETAIVEMQVLGILNKMLVRPWLRRFYTTPGGIDVNVMKDLAKSLQDKVTNPLSVLEQTKDFFQVELDSFEGVDPRCLRRAPVNKELFNAMMSSCLDGIVGLLERQYKKYFRTDVSDVFDKESYSAESLHNIDCEEIMEMYSCGKERAKRAKVDFLVAKLRAKKSQVVDWLNEMHDETREKIVMWSVAKNTKMRAELKKEKRTEEKPAAAVEVGPNKKEMNNTEKEKKDIEEKLKDVDLNNIETALPGFNLQVYSGIVDILSGAIIGRTVCHAWYDERTMAKTVWSGKIKKLEQRKGQTQCYRIAYWSGDESYENSTDYEVPKHELAADYIFEDLILW